MKRKPTKSKSKKPRKKSGLFSNKQASKDYKFKVKFPTKSKPLTKRRGTNIFDIELKPGAKSIENITDTINKTNFNKLGKEYLPDEFVKITFYARYRGKTQAITNIYTVDTAQDVKESIDEIWNAIYTKPNKLTKDYMKRMNHLKNYVNKITIDFDTAGTNF